MKKNKMLINENKMNLLLLIEIVFFCTLATVFGMAFDLRSKDNFVIIYHGVKYIPDWKWAAPYLVFVLLTLAITITHFVMYTIPNFKNKSTSLRKKYKRIFIIEIILLALLTLSGVGLSILGWVNVDSPWYVPERPWVTSITICFSFFCTILLLIFNFKKGGGKKNEK